MAIKQNHKWKIVEVPERLKEAFYQKQVCTRGECKCEKLTTISRGRTYYQYCRDGQCYSNAPECFGDTPLNDQGIDD